MDVYIWASHTANDSFDIFHVTLGWEESCLVNACFSALTTNADWSDRLWCRYTCGASFASDLCFSVNLSHGAGRPASLLGHRASPGTVVCLYFWMPLVKSTVSIYLAAAATGQCFFSLYQSLTSPRWGSTAWCRPGPCIYSLCPASCGSFFSLSQATYTPTQAGIKVWLCFELLNKFTIMMEKNLILSFPSATRSATVIPGPEGCCWHLPAQQRASASPTGSGKVFLPFLTPVLAPHAGQMGLICWIPWMQWTRCRRDGWFVKGQGWSCHRPGRGAPCCWQVTWNAGVNQLHFPHLRLSKNTNMHLFRIFKTDNTVTNVYKRCRQKK